MLFRLNIILTFFLFSSWTSFGQKNIFIDTLTYIDKGCAIVEKGQKNFLKRRKGEWKSYLTCPDFVTDSLIRMSIWSAGRIKYQKKYLGEKSFSETYYNIRGYEKQFVIVIKNIEVFRQTYNRLRRRGHHVEYYDNGVLKKKGNLALIKITNSDLPGKYFVNDGEWKYFDKDGNLTKTVIYENGEIIKD